MGRQRTRQISNNKYYCNDHIMHYLFEEPWYQYTYIHMLYFRYYAFFYFDILSIHNMSYMATSLFWNLVKLRSCVLCNDKLKVLTGHNRQIYSQMVHPFTVYDCILLISSQIGIKQETFKHCFNSCFIFTACGNYTYGVECKELCGNCSNGEPCHHVDGSCPSGCGIGVYGKTCDEGNV